MKKINNPLAVYNRDQYLDFIIKFPDLAHSHKVTDHDINELWDDINRISKGKLLKPESKPSTRKIQADSIYASLSSENQQLIGEASRALAKRNAEFNTLEVQNIMRDYYMSSPHAIKNILPGREGDIQKMWDNVNRITNGGLAKQDKEIDTWVKKMSAEQRRQLSI